MTAIAAKRAFARPTVPASVEGFVAIIEHYGFDYFFENTLRMIDISNDTYADVVDEAIDRYSSDYDETNFSIRKAFNTALNDLREEEGYSRQEALEILAEEGYIVPVNIAMYYSVDAGDSDTDRLSTIIRNRARRLLKQRAN